MQLRRTCVLTVVFLLSVELGLVGGAFAWQPVRPGACLPGSRGNVCLLDRPERLSVVAGDEPKPAAARAIPQLVTLIDEVWLQVSGLPTTHSITLTVEAPDGTICTIGLDEIEADPVTVEGPGAAQAFFTPASCARVEGVWAATFATSGVEAVARFLVIDPPPIRQPIVP